jgi:large subunit ribosomal protein L27
MAHTKAKGTTKLGRDSESKRLGVKIYGGSAIKCGQIIIRQRGTHVMAGNGVKIGKDDTLYAVRDGIVEFKKVRHTNFTGNTQVKQRVAVIDKPVMKPKTEKIVIEKPKAEAPKVKKTATTKAKKKAE